MKIVIAESGIIGFISILLGIIGGLLLSVVTVFVINKQTVGWYLEYSFPYEIIGYVFVGTMILSVLSGYYPAQKACETKIREALEYE